MLPSLFHFPVDNAFFYAHCNRLMLAKLFYIFHKYKVPSVMRLHCQQVYNFSYESLIELFSEKSKKKRILVIYYLHSIIFYCNLSTIQTNKGIFISWQFFWNCFINMNFFSFNNIRIYH